MYRLQCIFAVQILVKVCIPVNLLLASHYTVLHSIYIHCLLIELHFSNSNSHSPQKGASLLNNANNKINITDHSQIRIQDRSNVQMSEMVHSFYPQSNSYKIIFSAARCSLPSPIPRNVRGERKHFPDISETTSQPGR